MRSFLAIFILLQMCYVSVSHALEGLSSLSDADIREYAIAFVNMSTSPGLEGITLTVDNDERHSEQWRSSLGFNAEFTIRDIFSMAIGGWLSLEEIWKTRYSS